METNSLLCDPENGICEIPSLTGSTRTTPHLKITKPVKLIYFTDPICSACWGIEPQLRKLKSEYGLHFEMEYRMGGLLKDWSYNSGAISKPADVAHHWDEVSTYYDIPIDGDIWLEDPLNSSYPPSIAFKAAQLQDNEKAVQFLRRIREMVFVEKKNITRWEYLEQAAVETGLDIVLLKRDHEGKAKKLFYEDMKTVREYGVRGFPTLLFTDDFGNAATVTGFKKYEVFENTLLQLLPLAKKETIDVYGGNLFKLYATLTTTEYATLAGISKQQAGEELNNLFLENKITKKDSKNGTLWLRQ